MTQVNDFLATLTPEERESLATQLTAPKLPTPSQETETVLTIRVPEQNERGFVGYLQDVMAIGEAQQSNNPIAMFSASITLIEKYAVNTDKEEVKRIIRNMTQDELAAVNQQLMKGMTAPK